MNSKKTKGALFSSVIALMLCFSMLLGTTFAWFTDSVTSTNNIIKSGNLDVEVTNAKGDITGQAKLFQDVKLWEPGVVAYENLTVKNVGTLALKYQFCINFLNENFVVEADGTKTNYGLSSALKVAVVDGEITESDRDELVASITNWTSLKAMVEQGVLYAANNIPTDVVDAVSEKTYGVVIYWEPSDEDNNWNVQNGKTTSDSESYLHIDLGVNLAATQFTYEEDSFDHLYDKDAELPVYGVGSGSDAEYKPTDSAYEIPVYDINSEEQVGYAVIYAKDLASSIDDVEILIRETDLYDGLGVDIVDGKEAVTYEINAYGLEDSSSTEARIGLKALPGYNQAVIYHYDFKLKVVSYNETESYVEFTTTKGFSPFTAVYSVVEEDNLSEDIPVAVVTDMDEYENVVLEWKSFGGWSASHPEDQTLYSAYKFAAPHNSDTVENCAYKGWTCDYYVSIDQDIDAGVIFLGGNYGEFGWVGFENPIAISANQEIALLGSVTNTPWTYEDIVSFVGEFMCGVAETYGYEGKLAGATFTVKLRLTDPEDETKYYDVNTVKYTFEEKTRVTTADELKTALVAGEKEIYITEAITLTESLGATNVTFIGEGDNAGINFAGYNIGGSGSVTYKNLSLSTVSLPNDGTNGERYGWYGGIDYNGHSIANYENCTISGVFTTYSPVVNVTGCTFNSYVQDGDEFYNIFMYGAGTVNATNCTFMYRDRAIKIYSESAKDYVLNITGGKFVATDDYTVNKVLINVDSTYFASAVINMDGVKIDSKLASVSLHNAEGNSKVTVSITE